MRQLPVSPTRLVPNWRLATRRPSRRCDRRVHEGPLRAGDDVVDDDVRKRPGADRRAALGRDEYEIRTGLRRNEATADLLPRIVIRDRGRRPQELVLTARRSAGPDLEDRR